MKDKEVIMFDTKRANQGSSVVMALVFFLIASLVSVLVIGLSSMNVERNQHQIEQEQDQLTLSSALQQVRWWFMDSFQYGTKKDNGVSVCDWKRATDPLQVDNRSIEFPFCSDPSLDKWLREQSGNVLNDKKTKPMKIVVEAKSNNGYAESRPLSKVTVELTMDEDFNVKIVASLTDVKSFKYDDKSCLTTMINCDVVQYQNEIVSIMWCPEGTASSAGPTIRDVLRPAHDGDGSRYVYQYASKENAVAPNEHEVASSYAWGRTLNSFENNTDVDDFNPRNDYRWTYALNPKQPIGNTFAIMPDIKMCVDWKGKNANDIAHARLALIWHNGHYYYPALLSPEDNVAPQIPTPYSRYLKNNEPYDFTGNGDYLVWRRAA